MYDLELHGVFAVTIYGDKIRVSNYDEWGLTIDRWNILDTSRRDDDAYPLIRFFAVRAWDDPEWNLSRYRSLWTILNEQKEWRAA